MTENNAQAEKGKEKVEKKPTKTKSYFKNLFDFSQYDIKTIIYMIIFMFLIVISLYLLYYIYFVDETFLFRLVVEWFVNPIILLGIIGILLFLLIMAIQGLIVPIPSEIVLLAVGMIWGWFLGGLLGVAGSMLAGILCFYVSKKGGRPLAEKFIGKSALEMADDLIEKHGMTAIILARCLPFISFDAISYTAGLVDMDIKKYSIGTFIGTIPRAFFYSYLGSILIKHEPGQTIDLEDIPLKQIEALSQTFNMILLVVLVVLVFVFGLYYITGKMWEKKRLSGKYLAKIKQKMNENPKINVKFIRKAILMDEELFNKKIIEWSEKFNFEIDEGVLIINKQTLPDFYKVLDEQFAEMNKLREL